MYQIAYCDDEPTVGRALAQKVAEAFERCGASVAITFFHAPQRLMEEFLSGKAYDVLFLDVDMPGMDGIALCGQLKEKGYDPVVVFISNKEDQVYRSLQAAPVRFMRKSYFDREVTEAVSAVLRRLEQKASETVLLRAGKEVYRLPIREVLYLEIVNKTLTIYLNKGEVRLKYKLDDAERLLAPYGFLRCHKSYLVNYREIFSIRKDQIILSTGKALPLSRNRYKETTEAFLLWTRKELQTGDHYAL